MKIITLFVRNEKEIELVPIEIYGDEAIEKVKNIIKDMKKAETNEN